MSSFGISIFAKPQEFIALYTSMFSQTQLAIKYLQAALKRTKNPPLSIIYTVKFLDNNKTSEQYGLDIIRFISHLSDLSSGDADAPKQINQNISMQRSLENVLSQSSFLIEMRHSLAHKNMIEKNMVQISRKIILSNLNTKYWQPLAQKIYQTYNLNYQLILESYQSIYKKEMPFEEQKKLLQELKNIQNTIDQNWLISNCTNYEFKQFFPVFYKKANEKNLIKFLCESENKKLSSYKWTIAISHILKLFVASRRSEKLLNLLVSLMKNKEDNIMKEELVLRRLRQISFTYFLGYSRRLLQQLPEGVQKYLQSYWKQKGNKNKLYHGFYQKKSKQAIEEKCISKAQ